jgi:DNA-binding transcriptional ArsR family regulator
MPVPPTQRNNLTKTASLLKAVAHPTRLKILCLLGDSKKLSVNDISEKTACEQSLISHHLTGMKSKGILSVKREGKNIYYSLTDRKLLGILKCIDNCSKI